jgi:hypothetical protein
MQKNTRVFNLSNNATLKHGQALRAVEDSTAAWVEFGRSIRMLTLAESIALRNAQAQMREPLPVAEIPGLRFEAPLTAPGSVRREVQLAWEADRMIAMSDLSRA